MAWGRIALVHAAIEGDETLKRVACTFGFEQQPTEKAQKEPPGNGVGDGDIMPPFPPDLTTLTDTRPQACFLHVVRNEKIETRPDRPPFLDDPDRRLPGDNPPGSYIFPSPQPIVPASQLTPLFLHTLGRKKKTRRLDQPRLIRAMSRCRPLRKIPYRSQRRWPHRLHVLVDTSDSLEPYWHDFENIVTMLERILGEDSLDPVRLVEKSPAGESWDCIRWPTRANDRYRPWRLPTPDTPVLILSDFGRCSGQIDEKIFWRRLVQLIAQHPAPVLNLNPADHSPADTGLSRCLRPYPLNDVKPSFRYPGSSGFDLRAGQDEIIEEMLTLLSAVPLIDSSLLRPLRKKLQWGGAELEGLFWNRPELKNIGLGRHLSGSHAKEYQQKYKRKYAGGPEAKMVWQVLHQHYQGTYRGLKQLALLNQNVQEDRIEGSDPRHYIQQICATGSQAGAGSEQGQRLRSHGRTFLDLLPEAAWQSAYSDVIHYLFGMVHEEEIRQGKLPESIMPPGWDPAQLEYLLDDKARKEIDQWLLVQTGDQGEFRLFRRSADSHEPAAPIVELESLHRLPPVLHLVEGTSPVPLTEDVTVGWQLDTGSDAEIRSADLARTLTGKRERDGVVRVQSSLQTVEIECVKRPAWASALGQGKDGLWAEIPWLGREYRIERAGERKWLWEQPFGEDRYGLYVDLEILKSTLRFRWCKPGTFLMGSPENEPERDDDETLHQVTISRGFWLAETTVPQALWKAVMGGENPSEFKGDNRPVERVNWEDARKFITALNNLVPELSARLPWEAEWEYACRAGTTTTPFSFGDNITTDQVNFDGRYPYHHGEQGEYRRKTVPVKSMPCNNWGLYEMPGNVWEWCRDWYQEGLSDLPVVDPHGPETGNYRVVRGGSWIYDGGRARSACRIRSDPSGRDDDLGFRLARGHEFKYGQGVAGSRPLSGSAVRAEQRRAKTRGGLRDKFDKLLVP